MASNRKICAHCDRPEGTPYAIAWKRKGAKDTKGALTNNGVGYLRIRYGINRNVCQVCQQGLRIDETGHLLPPPESGFEKSLYFEKTRKR